MTTITHPSDRKILVVILLLALALRVAAALLLPDQNFPDAYGYKKFGEALWETGRLPTPYWMPLYPGLVGFTGIGWGQMAMDIALSVTTVWLVHRLTLTVFSDRAAALLAALMAAIYPFFIFFSVVGLTESLFITLLLGAFLCWYRGAFTLGSLMTVLAILTRPAIEPLAPLLILYFSMAIHRQPLRQALRHLVVFALIYVALMTPWWVHNYKAYGTFVRLDLAAGLVLYSGNNPMNVTGGGVVGPDLDPTPFQTITDPVERNRAFRDAAIGFIKDNPGRFAELAWLKFQRFWRLWPFAEEYSSPLYVIGSVISYVPIFILTLVYFIGWGWRERFRILPIVAWGGYLTAIHMVLIGSVRYRLPLEPFMIAFAAVALVRLTQRWPVSAAWTARFGAAPP